MVADFHVASKRVVDLHEQIDNICRKASALFTYNTAEDYPLHLNILGCFLYHKYYRIRTELIKAGAHVKFDAKYLVPLSGLGQKYGNLKVYIEVLSTIPNIEHHFIEVSNMLDYGTNPKPIKSEKMFWNEPIDQNEPKGVILQDFASV